MNVKNNPRNITTLSAVILLDCLVLEQKPDFLEGLEGLGTGRLFRFYRWCSLGYHAQSGNVGDFLSLDFGLQVHEGLSASRRLSRYRAFVYEKGSISPGDGCRISREDFDRARRKGFSVSPGDRFLYRTRYFIDSGIIGTREFVSLWYRRFRNHFSCRRDKRPMPVSGLNGIYSLKRLQE